MACKETTTPIEEFIALPDAEKDRIAAEFDREFIADDFRPLTAAERRSWRRAQRCGPDADRKDAERRVTIRIERSLLKQIDDYARAHGLKRSEFLAHSAKAVMTAGSSQKRRKAG